MEMHDAEIGMESKKVTIDESELLKIKTERDMYRQAIIDAIDYANGRESEWGERADQAFHFLYMAVYPERVAV